MGKLYPYYPNYAKKMLLFHIDQPFNSCELKHNLRSGMETWYILILLPQTNITKIFNNDILLQIIVHLAMFLNKYWFNYWENFEGTKWVINQKP